jgi:glycosyltransferase involved in cell wall biosynthesis
VCETMYTPPITIVIPTRNERDDIDETLQACIGLVYDRKEIIVVDDSTDGSAERIEQYADRGVRLVKRSRNDNGCCGARNLGMALANGDIVVLLNADNRPQPDFLTRILAHYRSGADSVVVRSAVANRESCWSSYLYTLELESHSSVVGMPFWSEGFSVRREAAAAVGYIPGDFPLAFCRDNALSPALEAAGYVRHYDPSIELPHVAPGTFRTFWQNRVWRGTMGPYTHYYLRRKSLGWVTFMELAKCVRSGLSAVLVFPGAVRAARRARRSSASRWEVVRLFGVGVIDAGAYRVGGLRAVRSLWAARLRRRSEL